MNNTNPLSSPLIGILWMILATSLIGIIDAIAKYVGEALNSIVVTWGYFLAMLAALLVYNSWRRVPLRQLAQSARPRLQFARACCLVGSLACLFSSLPYLSLTEATCISFTSPLFVVALAKLILAETVGWDRWVAVIIGLCGMLFIVKPGLAVFQWVAILPLIGAFFFALYYIVTKCLGSTDPSLTTLFYTFTSGAFLLSLAQPFVWQTPTPADCAWLLLSGILGALAHFALVNALYRADVSLLAPINYIRLIWAVVIGYFAFGQLPDLFTLLGGIIIIGSGLYVIYSTKTVS